MPTLVRLLWGYTFPTPHPFPFCCYCKSRPCLDTAAGCFFSDGLTEHRCHRDLSMVLPLSKEKYQHKKNLKELSLGSGQGTVGPWAELLDLKH